MFAGCFWQCFLACWLKQQEETEIFLGGCIAMALIEFDQKKGQNFRILAMGERKRRKEKAKAGAKMQ